MDRAIQLKRTTRRTCCREHEPRRHDALSPATISRTTPRRWPPRAFHSSCRPVTRPNTGGSLARGDLTVGVARRGNERRFRDVLPGVPGFRPDSQQQMADFARAVRPLMAASIREVVLPAQERTAVSACLRHIVSAPTVGGSRRCLQLNRGHAAQSWSAIIGFGRCGARAQRRS